MSEDKKEIPVHVPPELSLGTYANTFLIQNDGVDVLFDFLLFSSTNGKAVVISRTRIPKELLFQLRDKLNGLSNSHDVEKVTISIPWGNAGKA